MHVGIHIITRAKDVEFLHACLESVHRYCTGYSSLAVVAGTRDRPALLRCVQRYAMRTNWSWFFGNEPGGQGKTWAMIQSCRADQRLPHADIIAHVDSDCIFKKPFDFQWLVDPKGRPYWARARYDVLVPKDGAPLTNPAVLYWQDAVTKTLDLMVPSEFECMRVFPIAIPRQVYARTRRWVADVQGREFDSYVLSTRAAYPQTFCEYNTLGEVAHQCFESEVAWCKRLPFDVNDRVVQLWTHGGLEFVHDQHKRRQLDIIQDAIPGWAPNVWS